MTINPLVVRQTLLDHQLTIFTPREFGALFHLSPRLALYHLMRGQSTQLFTRLKNGLYFLASDPPIPELIANRLYRPSYLSFEYALAHYHLIPEAVYTLTSATPKTTREWEGNGISYSYSKIPQSAYTGYSPITQDRLSYLLAEPEKAVADYLYLVSLGRRPNNDRLDVSRLNHSLLTRYLSLFHRPSLVSLLQQTKESHALGHIY